MTVILQFVADNAAYVYGLCALVALYYLRVAILTRRERRSALFPLEREVALGRLYRTLGIAFLLLAVIGVTWSAGNHLLPRLEQIPMLASPTPSILVLIDTPTPTPTPPTITPTNTPTAPAVVTRAAPPPQQPATPTPVVRPPACPNPGAAIANPGMGQTVRGEVAVAGTASIDRFQFYKLEWSAVANPEQWNWFAGSEVPVVGGVLGVFNAGGLPPGAYVIRLVVVDNTGNYPSPCSVQVTVP